MADNSHGFQNERDFIDILNGDAKFHQLSENLKNFLKFLDFNITNDSQITAENIKGTVKPDIAIKIDGNKYYVSIKKGSGNSVHQESLGEFVSLLQMKNISEEDINNLKKFIWGDGTTDGTAEMSKRVDAIELKKDIKLMDSIKKVFDLLKLELLERVLFIGKDSSVSVRAEYIYYGTPNNGIWARKSDVLSYLEKLPNKKCSLSNLNFQAWNRSLEGNADHKRGVIQFKWASIESDLKKMLK